MRLSVITTALVMAGGCPKRALGPSALDAALTRADTAWQVRGREGLDPVQVALEEALMLARMDPRVRWRLARLDTARGMAATDSVAAQAAYARARGHGWECLDTVPGVADLRRSGAWSEALQRVPEALLPCVSWTGLAWTRWRQEAGLAGAIDDEAIREYVSAMPSDPDGIGAWAVAVSDSLYEQTSAGRSFSEAVRRDPDDLVRRIDRLLWVRAIVMPSALQTQGERLLERTADTPEEEGSLHRLREAMRTGTP